jgi:hypothetical protein
MIAGILVVTLQIGAGSYRAPSEEDIAQCVVRNPAAPKKSLAERLVDVTDKFVGAPYVLSPLGEGAGATPDPDPLVRWDAFDCTTFVETAMSLALADDLAEAKRLLEVIRYREARVDYLARRHFPEAEWIPELIKLGFLEDITRKIAGDEVVVEKKKIDVNVWKKNKSDKTPPLPDDRIPKGEFALDVWPLKLAHKGMDKIPVGTVMNIVRVDYSTVPVRVSHQALVIEKGGKRFVRHAADRMFHSVVDEPIDHFFVRMEKYGKWPVTGIHLTRFVEPPNWRALLPTKTASHP